MRLFMFAVLLAVPLLQSCGVAHASPPTADVALDMSYGEVGFSPLEVAPDEMMGQATPTQRSQQTIDTRGRAITASEETHFDQDATTGNPLSVMGNSASGGAAEAAFSANITQNFRIVNYHASNVACFKTVAKALSTDTCHTTCQAATTMTCRAGGGVTTGGTSLTVSMPPLITAVLGTDCLCVKATAASTSIETTRIMRAPVE